MWGCLCTQAGPDAATGIEPAPEAGTAGVPLAGVWEGPLRIGGQSIRIVFRVAADGRAVMDSPDQGARGIGAFIVTVNSVRHTSWPRNRSHTASMACIW